MNTFLYHDRDSSREIKKQKKKKKNPHFVYCSRLEKKKGQRFVNPSTNRNTNHPRRTPKRKRSKRVLKPEQIA
jgi:hypothetical protein